MPQEGDSGEQPAKRRKKYKPGSHYKSLVEEDLRNLVHFGSLVLRVLQTYLPPQRGRYARQLAPEEERRLIQLFNGVEPPAERTRQVRSLVEQCCARLNQARSEHPEIETNASYVRSSLYHVLAYQEQQGFTFPLDPLRMGPHTMTVEDLLERD